MASSIIRNFIAKKIFQQKGAIANRKSVDFSANALEQRLKNAGINPNDISSEKELNQVLSYVKQAEDAAFDQRYRVIAGDTPEGRRITEGLFGKRGEVVDMAGKKLDTSQGIMGGKSVKELMDSGQVSKGARGMKKSKKVQDREMFQDANKRLKTDVDGIIKNIKKLSPMDAMKEANLVIGRKQYYKNLTPEESKKILKDTEDHIFERDIPIDPEDMASGGRAGFKGGLSVIAQGSGGKSGKEQIEGAPEGITSNKETLNFIASLDIPITEKINLLGDIQYNKFRDKIQQGDDELFLFDPKSNRDRKIGIGFNKGGEGFSGYGKYGIDSGEPEFFLKYKKSFADGGVAGLLGERTRFAGGGKDASKSDFGKSKSSTNKGPAGGASAGGNYGGNKNPDQTYGGGNNNTGGGGGGGPPGTTTTGGETTTTPTLNRGFLSDVRKKNQQKYLNLLKTMKPDDFSTDSIIDDTTSLSDEELNFLSRYGIGTVLKDLSKTNIENFMDITDGVAPKVKDLEMDVDRPREYDFAELGKTPLDDLALGAGAGKVLNEIFKAGKGIKPYREGADIGVKYETLDKPFNTDFFKFKGGVNLEDTLKDAYETGNIKVKPQIGIEGSKGGVNYGITYDKDGNAKFNLFKKFADGGPARQNFAMGKRAFLKMLASAGAGIAGLKSGLIGFGGKGAAKKAVTETVKSAGTYPPPYFFKLVDKIKFMGDDITQKAATQEREIVKKYKDYEMTEDLGTGDIVIKKRNEGVFYDQDGIISDEYIVYKPGQADELTKGKKPPPEYDEYTVRPDADGKLRDSEDGLDSIDEILEEVGDSDSLTLKKASGGIARMLGE
jgi:hypothetical protein